MKRLIRDITLFFIIFVFIFSCRPITLSDKFSRNLQYDLIWVGWLDLGEQHYAELGYGSKEEWGNEIKKQNMNLQRHIQGYMRGWIVKGANAKTDEPPKDVGTVIILSKILN
jgi:hypothetical protein